MIKMFLETGLQEFLLSLHFKKETPLWSLITIFLRKIHKMAVEIYFWNVSLWAFYKVTLFCGLKTKLESNKGLFLLSEHISMNIYASI